MHTYVNLKSHATNTRKTHPVCLKATKTHQTSLLAGADIPANLRILTPKSGAKLKHTKKDACYPNRSKAATNCVVGSRISGQNNLTPKHKVTHKPQNEARAASTNVKMQTPKTKKKATCNHPAFSTFTTPSHQLANITPMQLKSNTQ